MGCYESDCESIVWFIDTQGSDLNDGSLENPFESIERAIDASINGDTIRLNPGNYFGPINFDGKDIVLESRAFELNDTSLIRIRSTYRVQMGTLVLPYQVTKIMVNPARVNFEGGLI